MASAIGRAILHCACRLLPLLVSLFFLGIVCSYVADLRTLYLSRESPRLLWWLRAHTCETAIEELRILFIATLLTRSSILRGPRHGAHQTAPMAARRSDSSSAPSLRPIHTTHTRPPMHS